MKYLAIVLTVAGSLAVNTARADTFYPMLMSIEPVAVQVGTVTECTVAARYDLNGTYKVFITGSGVHAEAVPPAKPAELAKKVLTSAIKLRFKAAADAMPGPREVRLATPQGVSTVGQIVVVRDPIVLEAANNDTMKTAQAITLPAAVCGVIEKPEDVDFYKFTVKADSALTFHVYSQRLQNRIHDLQEHADPILTLRNETGTVLAVNDNFFAGDPLLNVRFPKAGTYYLEIRDARYLGNRFWTYCIEINDRPFVAAVHPVRVTPGKPAKLRLLGYNLSTDLTSTCTLPADAAEGVQWVMLPLANNQKSNAVPVLVSRLPEVIEQAAAHGTAALAQPVTVPAGISGRIDKDGEADCYAFEAKAGERFTFKIDARELQSALDSNLRILDAKGKRLAENDDFRDRYIHADSRIENWAAPAAGRYIVEVRDLHRRSGSAFVYHLQMTRGAAHFLLELDTDKTLLAPGTASMIFVRAQRKNGFEGEIALHIDGLPAGVTASCGTIPALGTDGTIWLGAAADAPRGAAEVRVSGTAKHVDNGKSEELRAEAAPLQEVYMPGGGRHHFPVATHCVSVGDPLDLRGVKISPSSITLRPGESKKIDIVVERAPGFQGSLTLDAVYQHLSRVTGNSLPPGVTIDDKASKTLLSGTQTQGYITLKAAADARPVRNHQAVIMAHVSINFVMKFTYCGEPLRITVEK